MKSNDLRAQVFALLDNGSEVTFVTEALARQLKLSGSKEETSVATVNGTESPKPSMRVAFQISPLDVNTTFEVEEELTIS